MLQSKANVSQNKTQWKILLLCILGAMLLAATLLFPGANLPLDSESVSDFGTDWEQLDETGAHLQPRSFVTLPVTIKTTQTVVLQKVIPDGLAYPAVLSFRTAHQKVRLYCGNELLYSFGYDNVPMIGKSPGSAWNVVRLPQNTQGETLRLELFSPYPSFAGKVETISMGSKVAHVFNLLRTYTFSFFVTLVIFIAAIITLLMDFFVVRKAASIGRETLYLGLFALFVSLWLFGEGRLTQFFGIPPAVNTCLVFLWTLITPIPLVNYIICWCNGKRKLLLKIIEWTLYAVFAISVCLQLFGVFDFIEQMVFIHVSLALTSGLLLLVTIIEMMRNPCGEMYRLVGALGILGLCVLTETVGIYLKSQSVGNMMRLGVLIFIATQAQIAFKKALHIMKMSRFASVDALTGCLNRAAYTQRLAELKNQQNIGVVMADINNLKQINDVYGHETGDDAIMRCAKCFTEAFAAGGSCYRIGGDEFVMLGRNLTQERLAAMGAAFEAHTKAQCKQTSYPFAVSHGVALFTPPQDKTVSDTLIRADQAMYQNKRHAKQQEACATQKAIFA